MKISICFTQEKEYKKDQRGSNCGQGDSIESLSHTEAEKILFSKSENLPQKIFNI